VNAGPQGNVQRNYVSEVGDVLTRSGRAAIVPQKGLTTKIGPPADGMIAKTFFLTKIIHRIGTRSLRQEKSLRENLAGYRIFFTLRQPGRQF
jgi:hypothetical protein